MTAVDFIRAELKRLHAMLDKSLDDITEAQLHAAPGANVNTVAWNLFHIVRTERLDGKIALRALAERIPSMCIRLKQRHDDTYQMHGMNELLVAWNERE